MIAPIDLRAGTAVVLRLHPLRSSPAASGACAQLRPLGEYQFRIGMEFDTPTAQHQMHPACVLSDDALADCL